MSGGIQQGQNKQFAARMIDEAILLDNTEILAARHLEAAEAANKFRIAQDAVTANLKGALSVAELAKTLPTPFGLDPTFGGLGFLGQSALEAFRGISLAKRLELIAAGAITPREGVIWAPRLFRYVS